MTTPRTILLLLTAVLSAVSCTAVPTNNTKLNVAAIVTVYHHNSHADIIVSRLLQTHTLDGKGEQSPLKLVSLYTDQKPPRDTSRMLAASHRFEIYDTIEGALTLGGDKLAVDGVLIIGEHGEYPLSETGNTQYPKRRFFEKTIEVFKKSGRVVPVFSDKHVADNWDDAKFIYETVQSMNIPFMAGSSLPTAWREPAADVKRGAELTEIVALTFGSTDHYGFHALEFVQALAEQRQGGETGVVAVQCLTHDAVWQAGEDGLYDPQLFQAAWDRLPSNQKGDRSLSEAVKDPVLFRIEYADGLVAHILELNGAVNFWTAAWRYKDDGHIESAHFITQEGRPGYHFTILLKGIEQMMLTGRPSWPADRTLLTSGTLDALLISRLKGGIHLPSPHLTFSYQSDWRWSQPPPMPSSRPWREQ